MREINRMAPECWRGDRLRRGGSPRLLLLIAAAALGGCTAAGPRRQAQARSATERRSRTCSASETKRLVHEVVRAFNEGDTMALDGLIGQPPMFRWFSAPGPRARFGDAAYERSTLGEYARSRHRHRERLTILRLDTSDRADGNFALVIAREANDYRRRRVDAKGKVDCTGSTAALIAWSIGAHAARI